jgi:hypothetical protein
MGARPPRKYPLRQGQTSAGRSPPAMMSSQSSATVFPGGNEDVIVAGSAMHGVVSSVLYQDDGVSFPGPA